MRGLLWDREQKTEFSNSAGMRRNGGLMRQTVNRLTHQEVSSIFQSGLDINDILFIAFRAKKQLTKVNKGDWKQVTSRIQKHPIFYNRLLDSGVVCRIYIFVSLYDHEEQQPVLMLYAYRQDYLKQHQLSTGIEQENVEDIQLHQQKFDFDRYQEMIREQPQYTIDQKEEDEGQAYGRFASNVVAQMKQKRIMFPQEKRYKSLFQTIKAMLTRFKDSGQKVKLEKYPIMDHIEQKTSISGQSIGYMKTHSYSCRSKKILKNCELAQLLLRLKKAHP